MDNDRRIFLKYSLASSVVLLPACKSDPSKEVLSPYGALQAADKNSVRLPRGFSSRIIAHCGQAVSSTLNYVWHGAPDGAACYTLNDGGWLYISNSELDQGQGGVSALRFDAAGNINDAYAILQNTHRNCGGCLTPWGTWLSCEEVVRGRVWECDPLGKKPAVAHPVMGLFNHESAAIDPTSHQVYLTEDEVDGCLYRFTPLQNTAGTDLSRGELEVAQVQDGHVLWHKVPDPLALKQPARYQLNQSSVFQGGEGVCFLEDTVYFTTKHDNRVWALNVTSATIRMVYDGSQKHTGILRGVDDIISDRTGNLLVAEDGDDYQIVMITPDGIVAPIIQLVDQGFSEVTGLAFSPDYKRLYFSSQRGVFGSSHKGRTYEVTGPF